MYWKAEIRQVTGESLVPWIPSVVSDTRGGIYQSDVSLWELLLDQWMKTKFLDPGTGVSLVFLPMGGGATDG